MSKQEIFDKVAKHLLTQGRKATHTQPDANSVCMYRTPDGLKCAAGCLIPDEIYHPQMEGKRFGGLIREEAAVAALFKPEDLGLIFQLQLMHDSTASSTFKKTIPKDLIYIADQYNLNKDVLKEFSA